MSAVEPLYTPRGVVLGFAVAALLAAATLVLHVAIGRFVTDGPERLANAGFASGLAGWTTRGEVTDAGAGAVRLVSRDPHASTGVQQMLDGTADEIFLTLAAEARSEDVVRGRLAWQTARLLLASRDDRGRWRFGLPHEVMRLRGTNDWSRYEKTFRVPPTDEILVLAQLIQATGAMEVRGLSVRQAHGRPGFDIAARTLMAGWLVAGLWILWPLFRGVRRDPVLLPLLAVIAGIAVATLATQDNRLVLRAHVDPVIAWFEQVPRPAPTASAPAAPPATARPQAASDVVEGPDMLWQTIDRAGHFTAYTLLAALALIVARRRAPSRPPWLLVLTLLAAAGLTEVMQLMSEDRHANPDDALINAGGVVTGLVLASLCLWLVARFRPAARRAG